MKRLLRPLLWLLGGVALALGVLGLFLPVLPTTPFVLLAAGCWARASPRLHGWLLAQPRLGPIVQRWDAHRAVPRRAKWLSSTMMAASCALVLGRLAGTPHAWLAWAMAATCLAVGVWIWRRPD